MTTTTFVLEWQFIPTINGGRWGGQWRTHTVLKAKNLQDAKKALEIIQLNYDESVRKYFRLVKNETTTTIIE